jgi:hypothetical protein
MPRRDGTGPMGAGAMTGRGLGQCTGVAAQNFGAGLAFRRGNGRGLKNRFFANPINPESTKEILQHQKEILKSQLEAIEIQIENL